MKHFWALPSTLLLSSALAVTGVAATASIVPGGDASSLDASSLDNGSSTDGRATPPVDTTVLENGFYWQLTSPQLVQPGSVLVWGQGTKARRPGPGRRSDTQFFEISSTGTNDVPDAALRAYHHAEKVMATADPGCDISWTMLAAIGRVESNHGRYGGAQLGSDGVSRPEIRGPQLDGAGPFAAIRDTDNGTLDRDKVWDRAVGQMQFLPGTWREVARDGDGDGQMNPDDIDDSALGSAVYLCGAGGSLADAAGKARAAFRYNHSDYYVDLVLAFDAGYQSGVFALPSPPPPPDEADRRKGHDKPGRKKSAPKKPTSKKHRSPKAPLHQAAPTPAPRHADAEAGAEAPTQAFTARTHPHRSPAGPGRGAVARLRQRLLPRRDLARPRPRGHPRGPRGRRLRRRRHRGDQRRRVRRAGGQARLPAGREGRRWLRGLRDRRARLPQRRRLLRASAERRPALREPIALTQRHLPVER